MKKMKTWSLSGGIGGSSRGYAFDSRERHMEVKCEEASDSCRSVGCCGARSPPRGLDLDSRTLAGFTRDVGCFEETGCTVDTTTLTLLNCLSKYTHFGKSAVGLITSNKADVE